MIQAEALHRPTYAYRLLRPDTPGDRLARADQSRAAEALLGAVRAEAGLTEGPSSKAHSRAMVVAAAARTGLVGVDVEFHAPGRRIEAIAQHLMGARAPGPAAAYRVFTFYEAYFKAVGRFPAPAAMRAVMEAGGGDCTIDGLAVSHAVIERDFTLTLVWGGAGQG